VTDQLPFPGRLFLVQPSLGLVRGATGLAFNMRTAVLSPKGAPFPPFLTKSTRAVLFGLRGGHARRHGVSLGLAF